MTLRRDCPGALEQSSGLRLAEWVAFDTGKKVEIATDWSCGTIEADSTGQYSAAIVGKACGSETYFQYRLEPKLTGGTLDMDESRGYFGVSMQRTVEAFDAADRKVNTCSEDWNGRLVLKAE